MARNTALVLVLLNRIVRVKILDSFLSSFSIDRYVYGLNSREPGQIDLRGIRLIFYDNNKMRIETKNHIDVLRFSYAIDCSYHKADKL